MTTTESSILHLKTQTTFDSIEVSWPAVIASASEFPLPHIPQAESHACNSTLVRVSLILTLERIDERFMLVQLWLSQQHHHRHLLREITVPYTLIQDREFFHLDAFHDERCVVSMTIDADDELIYARSDLLHEAGFTGGSCNAPSLTRLIAGHDIATA